MNTSTLLITLIALILFGYWLGRYKLGKKQDPKKQYRAPKYHSLPAYYGYMTSIWCGLPALLLLVIWVMFQENIIVYWLVQELPLSLQTQGDDKVALLMNQAINAAKKGHFEGLNTPELIQIAQQYRHLSELAALAKAVVVIALALLGMAYAYSQIKPETRARNKVERIIKWAMLLCAGIAILTTVGIVASVLFESIRFFSQVPISEFIFGTNWSPQTAIRADQVGASGSFGAVPLFVGTLLISGIALLVSIPLGLMSAIYLSEYASMRFRSIAKPALEILAGIPTVVYGFFAALVVAPWLHDLGASLGLDIAPESALAAGLVMGVMIVPFVSSLSDDVINAVPQAMRNGAYGMGATQSETIKQVIIPAALPGIVGAFLLAASRAIGETMIVVMAAGMSAKFTANPFEAVTTVTVQIVSALKGDQEFDSTKTLAAFALGLTLFVVTLLLNVIALKVVRRYREQYE